MQLSGTRSILTIYTLVVIYTQPLSIRLGYTVENFLSEIFLLIATSTSHDKKLLNFA